MKTYSWTPGPWRIRPNDDNDKFVFIEAADGRYLGFCEIATREEGISEREGCANASLVAAAPEMALALESCAIALELAPEQQELALRRALGALALARRPMVLQPA